MNRKLAGIAGTAAVLAACADSEGGSETTSRDVAQETPNMQATPGDTSSPAAGADGRALLTVVVEDVSLGGGEVLIALQDRATFATTGARMTARSPATGRTVTVPIEGVPPGTYAVSAFQDTNGDGAIDIRSNGPSEPFGFSGPVQAGWPEYELADFTVNAGEEGLFTTVALQPPVTTGTGVTETD